MNSDRSLLNPVLLGADSDARGDVPGWAVIVLGI